MIFSLDDNYIFPDPTLSEPDGLLAIGGDLHPDRLVKAYEQGIFPWYSEDDPILWWSPNPRCVVRPTEVHVSKSMLQLLKKNTFRFTMNQEFIQVITNCATIKRKHEDSTWINHDIIQAYSELHKKGFAHSIEVWKNDTLVGGFYGIAMGKMFFGESMFSKISNASKAGFIWFADKLAIAGFELIDCQVYNDHLASLGAIEIPRASFLESLHNNSNQAVLFN